MRMFYHTYIQLGCINSYTLCYNYLDNGECSQVVKAVVCGTTIRGFKSRHSPFLQQIAVLDALEHRQAEQEYQQCLTQGQRYII